MLYSPNEITQAPLVKEHVLRAILTRAYGIEDFRLTTLTGYEDCNFRLDGIQWKQGSPLHHSSLIVKVTNPIEARDAALLDLQYSVCASLIVAGVPCPIQVERLDGRTWARETVADGVSLPVRLFPVLPGRMLEEFEFTDQLIHTLGSTMANMHQVLDTFPATLAHIPFISPENNECLERELTTLLSSSLLDSQRCELARTVFQQTRALIASETSREGADRGLIHSDVNETNVLIEERDGKMEVSGVLDFGDMHVSLRVFDVAAAVIYMQLSDRMERGLSTLLSAFSAGYSSIRPLPSPHLILPAMRARMACSLVYGLRTARLNSRGGSVEYVLKTQSNGWKTLEYLVALQTL